MIIHSKYSKKYIKLGVITLLFLTIIGFSIHNILGTIFLVISIALFSHKEGIAFDRKSRKIGFYSQFFIFKFWISFSLKEISKVEVSSQKQFVQATTGYSIDEWSVYFYNLSFFIKDDELVYNYGFQHYRDAKIVADILIKKYKINVKNYVQETQIKAMKTRKEVEKRRLERIQNKRK